MLSWNPGPPRGEDHSAVANHICGPWHIICLQEGAGVAKHPPLHHRFQVVAGCCCSGLLNKDTCERLLDLDHVNQKCAARRSIRINLLSFWWHRVRPRRSDVTRWRLIQRRPDREVGRTLSCGGFFQPRSGAVTFAWQQCLFWGSGKHEVVRLLWHFKLPHTAGGSSRSTAASTWIPRRWASRRRTNPTTRNCGCTSSTFALRRREATDVAKEATARSIQGPCADVSGDGFARRAFALSDARDAFVFLLNDVRRSLLPVLSRHLFARVI